MAEKKPTPEAKKAPEKAASKKAGFELPKLTEKQWGMAAGGLFFLGYVIYTFLGSMPEATTNNAAIGIGAQMTPKTAETEEERFKRENKNASLPDGSGVSQKEVAEKTKLTQQVPFGDREMEFRVRLPNNWVMSEFARYGLPGEESYSVLTNIARYFGPAVEDARPYLWVEVERIKRYTTAETWARAYMIKRGIAPSAFIVKSKTDIQALYVDVRDFRSYAVRSLFHVEGDTMVLVSYGVPISSYKESKDMMGLTLNSFQILNPIHREIEEIKQQKLLNVIQFDYYASWQPKNVYDESTLRPSIELHNPQQYNNPKGDLLQGLILVNAWRKSAQFPEDKDFKEVKDRLQELRMTLKEPLEEAKALTLPQSFVKAVRTPYLAQVNTYIRKDQFDIVKSDESRTFQEVWITVLDNDYYLTYLTLITPLKATNYVVWAQNMAAYDLLTQSIVLRGQPKD